MSQIESYYETLSGSYGRSFRIRYEESPEALPDGEITTTSYIRLAMKPHYLGNHGS